MRLGPLQEENRTGKFCFISKGVKKWLPDLLGFRALSAFFCSYLSEGVFVLQLRRNGKTWSS